MLIVKGLEVTLGLQLVVVDVIFAASLQIWEGGGYILIYVLSFEFCTYTTGWSLLPVFGSWSWSLYSFFVSGILFLFYFALVAYKGYSTLCLFSYFHGDSLDRLPGCDSPGFA